MSQSPASPDQAPKNDGWWYPLIYVGAFVVIIVVNMFMLYFATRSFSGLSANDPYMTGNNYNTEIAAAEAQKRLGWKSTLSVDVTPPPAGFAMPAGSLPTRLSLAVTDRNGKPVEGLLITVELRRPTKLGMDQRVELATSERGVYTQWVGVPAPGQWDVRVLALRDAEVYRLSQRALIQPPPAP